MKQLRFLIFLFGLCVSISAAAQLPIVLEAENAKLFGDLKIGNVSGFSGGKYTHDFHVKADSYFLYENVEVAKAGTYEFRVYSTGTSRPFFIKVNQYERIMHWTKDSPDWNAPPTSVSSAYIYLDAGTNIIKIGSELEDGPNIDKFEIHTTSTIIGQPEKVRMALPYDFTDEAVIKAEYNNNTLPFLTDNDETTFYEVPGVTSATITIDCKEDKVVTAMLISGGRGIDASNWKVEYSSDGVNWKQLTAMSSKITGMGDLTLFSYDRNASNARNYAARYYRLTATGTKDVKISEWQLFGVPFLATNGKNFPADITEGLNSGTQVSGSPDGKSNEGLANLFDRKLSSKYCADGTRFYVQYILDKAYKFNSYTVTSANDAPERDPKLWSLSGYNPDEGWIELDEQRGFSFPGRYTTMKFDIDSDKEFTAFILEVSSIKSGNLVQLGNLQVFGEPTGNPGMPPVLPGNPSSDPKERAAELVKLMTKSEKLSYVGGVDWMFTKDIPRLKIPRMKMSDGPQGVGTWGASTAYPCGILLASTWNEDLAWSYGEALALDCRARGVNILLGPGVNIHRAPMCGRNFEYMGEDPYLTSRTAVGYIKGLQENGVMAVIKHFAANYQEYDRNYISSDIDERTLNEIYFPAFRAAVQEAKVGSVMSSYNLLNGIWTTHDPWLLRTVLRDQWGFDGILMSDWGSTHHCLPAANGGLDLEMAGGEKMNPDSLRYYINKGSLEMSTIEEKVGHILQTMIKFGFMDNEQLDTSVPKDNPYTAKTTLNVAREGIVLLKNQEDILPLKIDKVKSVVIVGKNATRYVTGGGSGRVEPIRYTSFYDGIAALGSQKGFNVKYIDEYDHLESVIFTESGLNGFNGEYFSNKNLQGSPVAKRTDKKIDFNFQNGTGLEGVGTSSYSIRWTGELRPVESGEYVFTLGGDDGFRLYINGQRVIDDWNPGQERYKTYKQSLTAGNAYNIKVEYFQDGGAAMVDFYWSKSGAGDYFLTSLNEADVVIACIGHDSSTEAEGSDRTFELPTSERNLVNKILKTTTPVLGVVTAGGNVEMQSWEPQLKGLLWTWYAGQEGGTALAEIIFGDVNPSGKLPVTFEKKWTDNPVYNSYDDRDGDKHVKFTEGIFVGYRGYDKLDRQVQYPFGYGLSYTTFSISGMTVSEASESDYMYKITCELTNTGKVAGAEVVQLYVGKKDESIVERPLKELKAFRKIFLEPGQTKTVTMYLSEDDFSFFDVNETAFVLDKGLYEISLGFSSRNLVQKQNIIVNDNTSVGSTIAERIRLVPTIVKSGEPVRIKNGRPLYVSVYNVSGTLISNSRNTEIIDTTGFENGIYIAHLHMDETIVKEKFIVK